MRLVASSSYLPNNKVTKVSKSSKKVNRKNKNK